MICTICGASLVSRARLQKQLQQKAWQAHLLAVQQRAVPKLWQAQTSLCQFPAGAAAPLPPKAGSTRDKPDVLMHKLRCSQIHDVQCHVA